MKWFAAYLVTITIILTWNHARCLQMVIKSKPEDLAVE